MLKLFLRHDPTLSFSGWGPSFCFRFREKFSARPSPLACIRQDGDAAVLGVTPGNSKYQSFWEMVTLLLCLVVWGHYFHTEVVAVVGDNTGAMQNALDLKGRGVMLAVAREIAWRKERFGWMYTVGHIPSEYNTVPDALSRLHDSPPSAFPREALCRAAPCHVPAVANLWKAVAFPR